MGTKRKVGYMMQGSLPTRLRVLRAERGLTVREAAAITGVAKETLSDLERGTRQPQDRTLARIARGYDIPIEELLPEEAGVERFLAKARDKSRAELVERYLELTDRLDELAEDPVGLPRKLGGQATRGERGRHLREFGEVADEARAVAQVLAERVENERYAGSQR